MNEPTKKTSVKPVKTVRQGAVAANIWKRQAPSGFEYYDFSLSRSWKAKSSGREGYSPNFFVDNEECLGRLSAKHQAGLQASKQACRQTTQLRPNQDSETLTISSEIRVANRRKPLFSGFAQSGREV